MEIRDLILTGNKDSFLMVLIVSMNFLISYSPVKIGTIKKEFFMPQFLVVEVVESENEIICIVQAKNEEQAKEKFKKNIKKWHPAEYNYLKKSLTGEEEFYFIDQGCDRCDEDQEGQGTCDHACIHGQSWWHQVFLSYFDGDQTLAKIVNIDHRKINTESVEKIIDFILEKEDNLKYLKFINLNSINHFK